MNKSYGVDPLTPRDRRDLALLARLFQPWEGRFIVRFPDDWCQRLRSHTRTLSDLDQARADEVARRLQHSLLPYGDSHRYDDRRPWAENANAVRLQQQVASLIGPPDSPAGRLDDLLDEASEHQAHVPRTVAGYLSAMDPLLRTSAQVVLVDRYFRLRTERGDWDRRRVSLLKAIIERAVAARRVSVLKLVVSRDHACRSEAGETQFRQDFKALMDESASESIEPEVLFIENIKAISKTPVLLDEHPRYLLGLHSGLIFDKGFELSPEGLSHPVSWLTSEVLKPLLDRYV